MSWEYVKNIKHDKKNNRYFVTTAPNNIYPRSYSTWEYMKDDMYNKEKIENQQNNK